MRENTAVLSVLLGVSMLTGPLLCAQSAEHGEPPVIAPFPPKLDSFCINKWWENLPREGKNKRGQPLKIVDTDVPRDQVLCFGIYTAQRGVMKMTAQLFPLYPDESRIVRLELKRSGEWQEVQRQKVNDIGCPRSFE